MNKNEVTIVCIDDEEIIREKGFKGSSSTIRHYASEWKKDLKKMKLEKGKELLQ